MKYKMRYDYRLKKADGEYIRILHQAVAIEHNEKGEIFRTFGVHTDITSIKKDGKPVMSYIGLEGEPSYINVKPKKVFTPSEELFSKREKEILYQLAKGNSSIKIAGLLNISKHTVDTHRRNMLQKTSCTNVTQLVSHSIVMGYI
jgi:DNA-binding CsgD family transcriptional regulator